MAAVTSPKYPPEELSDAFEVFARSTRPAYVLGVAAVTPPSPKYPPDEVSDAFEVLARSTRDACVLGVARVLRFSSSSPTSFERGVADVASNLPSNDPCLLSSGAGCSSPSWPRLSENPVLTGARPVA